MAIVCVGIDLAKNVFALHGVNAIGAVQLRQPKVARAKLDEMVAAMPPCNIGIEACSGAHHWARLAVGANRRWRARPACAIGRQSAARPMQTIALIRSRTAPGLHRRVTLAANPSSLAR